MVAEIDLVVDEEVLTIEELALTVDELDKALVVNF